MDSSVKSLLIFTSGAAAGGSVAAFFVHRWAKKKYMAMSDDKVKSLEEYIDRIRNGELVCDLGYDQKSEVTENGDEKNGNYISDGESDAARIAFNKARNESKAGGNGEYIDYTQYSKSGKSVDPADYTHPVDSDENEYDEFDEDEYEEAKRNELSKAWSKKVNSGSKPKIIPFEEYGSTGYLDEVILYFYQEDGVLTTENDEVIDDISAVVGDSLTKFGFDKNDEKVIYVRNYSRSTDYEISKIFSAFSERDIS